MSAVSTVNALCDGETQLSLWDAPRYPMAPLEKAAGSIEALSEVVGVSVRKLYDWRKRGLDLWRADRWAVAVNRHPLDLWPDWGMVE